MGYLGTKPANSPLTSELIPNSIITNAKINDVAATKLTGQVADANAPSGSVIQVVNAFNNTPATTSTAGAAITCVSASITPSSSSSNILIIARVPTKLLRSTSATAAWMSIRITRNGSVINPQPSDWYENGINFGDTNWSDFRFVTFIQSLDSPSTTSSVSYVIQALNYNTNQLVVNEDGIYRSSITLMEIAG